MWHLVSQKLITEQSDSTMSLYQGGICTSEHILDQFLCTASWKEVAKGCSMSEKKEDGMILVNIDSCRGLCYAATVWQNLFWKITERNTRSTSLKNFY